MLRHLRKPIIFAHRGASAYAPENTISAFELAVQQKADAIELDTKLTIDGHVVVFHDQTLDRTTGASGRVIDSKLADLKLLDAGSHFDIAFRGEPIPTLEEVFEAVGKETYINVELTNYASLTDRLPELVAEIVKKHNLVDRVLFSSFNPLALIRARRALPQVPIGLLADEGKKGRWARSWPGTLLRYQTLHPAYQDVDAALVERTHQRGCGLITYTVNSPDEIKRLFQLDVDGIFTDDPPTAIQILSATNQQRLPDKKS